MYGVDEAGRGPVIGSMFIACAYGNVEDIPNDVKDSKKLSNKKIAKVRKEIDSSSIETSVVEVKPKEIDESNSLTELCESGFSKAISKIDKPSDKIVVDSFSNNKDAVRDKLLERHPEYTVEVEFEADDKYQMVSVASIIAKSEREKHIERLSEKYGDIGSGYPSDPTTKEYLENYYEKNEDFPDFVRNSWGTIERIKD